MDKRFFSQEQKNEMFIRQQALCIHCKETIYDVEKAIGHHRQPWPKGKTTMDNGQLLHIKCHVAMHQFIELEFDPVSRAKSRHQAEVREEYADKDRRVSLLVEWTGTGKSRLSMGIAHDLIRREVIDYVVIITPSKENKSKFCIEANEEYLDLSPSFTLSKKKAKHGYCLTYDGLNAALNGKRRENLLWTLRNHKVLIVFDEPHHLGLNLAWGDAAKEIDSLAERIIGLTATPWRSDEVLIPIFGESDQLDEKGRVTTHMTQYRYGDALRDGIVKYVRFHAYDASILFPDGEEGELSDETNGLEALRVYANTIGPSHYELFKKANLNLESLREETEDIGGIIVVPRRRIAEIFQTDTKIHEALGEIPTIVHTDTDDAIIAIDQFRKGKSRWIVCVGMISEGTDIPRLGVLLYLSTVRTKLALIQRFGRPGRRRSGDDISIAHIHIPNVAPIIALSKEIEEEIAVSLYKEGERKVRKPPGGDEKVWYGEVTDIWEAYQIYRGEIENIPQADSDSKDPEFLYIAEQTGGDYDIVKAVITLWRESHDVLPQEIKKPQYVEIEELKALEEQIKKGLVNLLEMNGFNGLDRGDIYKDINTWLISISCRKGDAGVLELKNRISAIEQRIQNEKTKSN